MMRSLYSGVSGLRVHQTKMDVIGNNIANVNTVGFKASSVTFSDVFYQTLQSATGPNATTGAAGQNAKQIGLGSGLASITAAITTTGGSQRTDNPFDIMISGDSFFVVNNGGTNYFTKAGSFGVDAQGTLSTATGATVMGWLRDPNDETKVSVETVKPLKIMSPENLYAAPEATTNAFISGNIDKNDTQIAFDATGKTGRTIDLNFYDNLGHSYKAILKVVQDATATNQYTVNLDDIRDSDGNSMFVTKDATGKYIAKTTIPAVTLGGTTYTVTSVNPDTGKVTLNGAAGAGAGNILTFNGSDGSFTGIGAANSTNKAIDFEININGAGGGATAPDPFEKISVDFSSVTMYATSGVTTLESTRGDKEEGRGAGKKVGNMTGVSIDAAGKIYGKYDNGDSRLLGQIATANFANPAGLEAVGNSMFAQTQNSGEFDGVGKDITASGGGFTTGVLEMSNVDLSAQFTDMITTQRGFQANSRIITTSDTLLEELINLKR